MKKFGMLLCTVLTAAMLTACGNGNGTEKTTEAKSTTAEVVTTVADTTEETTAEKTTEEKTTEAKTTEAKTEAETTVEDTAEAKTEAKTEKETDAASNPFDGKTVKVGCSATFVPYESIEMAADGTTTHVGMNIDIITAVVEKNGGKVEFVDMPFKTLIASIQAGQIDFCSGGMAPTEERKKTLNFSEVFFYPRNAIVYRSEDNYPDLASLEGKTIAYVFGTNYQQVAESVEGASVVGIQGSPACIEEVKSKRADACIIDGAGATEYLKENESLAMSLLDKTDDCFAIGFPKDSPYYETFNETLKEMMENGELDAIVAEHLNEQFILD
ncbi:MAG: amino acid ABC transporter substrate-binding protein [Lachnospiraceae bacterium]|nr:amino acid ABC transporter substrate-binding protein [Lachnospiraceae bacterium]